MSARPLTGAMWRSQWDTKRILRSSTISSYPAALQTFVTRNRPGPHDIRQIIAHKRERRGPGYLSNPLGLGRRRPNEIMGRTVLAAGKRDGPASCRAGRTSGACPVAMPLVFKDAYIPFSFVAPASDASDWHRGKRFPNRGNFLVNSASINLSAGRGMWRVQ